MARGPTNRSQAASNASRAQFALRKRGHLSRAASYKSGVLDAAKTESSAGISGTVRNRSWEIAAMPSAAMGLLQ